MKKVLALIIYFIVAFFSLAYAEIRTMSWSPVTTYTDGSLIESNKIISYAAYWTIDNTLSTSSLHLIGAIGTATFVTFDPDFQGMNRGAVAYFTVKSMLNTGEESALAPAFPWLVPIMPVPGKPSLNSVVLRR